MDNIASSVSILVPGFRTSLLSASGDAWLITKCHSYVASSSGRAGSLFSTESTGWFVSFRGVGIAVFLCLRPCTFSALLSLLSCSVGAPSFDVRLSVLIYFPSTGCSWCCETASTFPVSVACRRTARLVTGTMYNVFFFCAKYLMRTYISLINRCRSRTSLFWSKLSPQLICYRGGAYEVGM